MSLLRPLALACAVLHVSALAVSCPIAPQASEPIAHHAMAHGDAHGGHAACAPPLKLEAPCPCGCEDPGVAPPSARLGWAELPEVPEATPAPGWMSVLAADVRLPATPDAGIDPVPI